MTSAEERDAAAKAKTLPFKPRDLSGVWGLGTNGFNLDQRAVPPMTPEGKAKYDAAKPGLGPRGVPLGNDPLMICDPVGYPRSFTYNYGMEFIETPGRTLQFFEWGHTWRTIWTDGRALPAAVDEPRWYGYAIGRWEGDTFVVESTGYDERSWLDQDGHPHSGAMRVVERYRRAAADTMEVTVTAHRSRNLHAALGDEDDAAAQSVGGDRRVLLCPVGRRDLPAEDARARRRRCASVPAPPHHRTLCCFQRRWSGVIRSLSG